MPDTTNWETARDEFIAQWGALGTCWGINRTMAQIHALLFTAPTEMSTDEVMEKLEISRGNAHTNLKELVDWGLIRIITKKGDRKEYFAAEKDVWTMAVTIAKERKRRELIPAQTVLKDCASKSKEDQSPQGQAFHRQMKELEEFVAFGIRMSDIVSGMKHSSMLQWAMRLMS